MLNAEMTTETRQLLEVGQEISTDAWERRDFGNLRYGFAQKLTAFLSRSNRKSLCQRLGRLMSEFRNCVHRIGIALRNSDAYRVPMGFLYLESPNGRVYLNTRNLARSDYIGKLVSNLHPATALDWKSHCDAWDQGVEWAVGTLGSGSSLTDEHKALLASELSYRGPQPS
jgi:hypothetical protein